MTTLREKLAAAVTPVQSDADDEFADESPDPQATTRDGRSAYYRSHRGRRAVQRVQPPEDDLEEYWRQYETTPLLSAPIDQFADDVTEDGYRIKAADDETKEFLERWASQCYIDACDRGNDLRALLEDIPVQLPVRGTVLIEHVSAAEDSEKLTALQLIRPETVTPYKRPDSDLLVQPEDTDLEEVKLTEDGRAAAYVQYDRRHGYGPDDDAEVRLAADEVTRLVRAADIGEVFGTSMVEGVSERVEAIKRKLEANEEAIASMAYGRWFFGFEPLVLENETGMDEVLEWSDDDMQAFMDELDALEPGAHVGHDGTIDVENLPGETADILEFLEFDVDYILSAMPAPKYSVGWESDINQFVSNQQEQSHEQRVADMRRDIENALTPILQTVAEQNGYDPADVELSLEPEDDESPIRTLTDEQVERVERYANAIDTLPAGVASKAELRDLVLQLPDREDAPADFDDLDALEPDDAPERGEDAVDDGEPADEPPENGAESAPDE